MSSSDGEDEGAQFGSANGTSGDSVTASMNRARRLMMGLGLGRGKSTARRAMEDWIEAPSAIDEQKKAGGRRSGRGSGRSGSSGSRSGEGGSREGEADKDQESNKPNRAFFSLNREAAQSYNNLRRRLWCVAVLSTFSNRFNV